MKKVFTILVLFLAIFSIDSFAYEVGTHEAINIVCDELMRL